MRSSLAIKIFLSFWLIHALIFAVLALVPDPGADAMFLDHARRDAWAAAVLYERHGQADCSRFLAVAHERAATQIGLYDTRARLLCSSTSPIDDAPYRSYLTPGGNADVLRSIGNREVAVLTVGGPSGTPYRAALVTLPGAVREPQGRPIPYGFLVTAVIVSGVVCLLLARSLASPLQRMRAATHRLKEGDLSARAGSGFAGRNDEIGDVVRDFDSMAERIESLVRAQRQLLSDISHELRSPLARLNVALELARRTSGPAAEGHLGRIEMEAERMNDLIGRLLALARAENAGTGHAEDFDLEKIVQRVTDDAQYEARRMGKSVSLPVHDSAPMHGDPSLLASAVENVVRNAVRHTAPGSAVEVLVTTTGTHAQVAIRDHGPGVPDSELDRVFAPFHRVDASRDRESGGVGLGLSIAHRAVATLGGTITAENADGGGLKVTITLPTRAA
jgi:two-component system, OmpR family, sensor histidine kinase CpxA